MSELTNVSYVPVEPYGTEWVALCLDGALVYKQWVVESREPKTLMPTASKISDGVRFVAKFWRSREQAPSQHAISYGASHLAVAIQPLGAQPKPEMCQTLRQELVGEIERLKPGTVADLPFDAGGCLEN